MTNSHNQTFQRTTSSFHIFACFLAYRIVWELRQRLHPVLERDPDTNQCEAGSLHEVWRVLKKIFVTKFRPPELGRGIPSSR